MILTCKQCGGLYGTEHMDAFAGTPCSCSKPTHYTAEACAVCGKLKDFKELIGTCRSCRDRISQLESDSVKYHKIMSLLKDTQLPHGLCQPRSRRACTCCNAKEEIDKMMINYKGRIIRAQ